MSQNNRKEVVKAITDFFGPQDNYGNVKFYLKHEGENEREYRITFKPRVIRWEVKSVCRTRWIKHNSFGYNDVLAYKAIERIKDFYNRNNCYRR